jgi:hypothetical protein
MADDDRKSQESPYYQPEGSGTPAENESEREAREDYNQEREEKGDVDMSTPDWAQDIGPKKD